MKKILKQLAILGGFLAIALTLNSTVVFANGFFGGGGAGGSVPGAVIDATGGQSSFRQLLLTIVGYFMTFLGLLAVLMIIYAGVLYVTAAGKDDQVDKAKKIILYSIVGLLVIMLSWALVNTVLGAGTGQESV